MPDPNTYRNPSTGLFDHAGSTNAGIDAAKMGTPLASQQPKESWQSYETRKNAYDSAIANSNTNKSE